MESSSVHETFLDFGNAVQKPSTTRSIETLHALVLDNSSTDRGAAGGANYVVRELHRDEHDLAVGRLCHLLQGLELTDLHSGGRSEDVSCLPHEPCGVDLCSGGDDL